MSKILDRIFGREAAERPLTYADMHEQTGFTIAYTPREDGGIVIAAKSEGAPLEITFPRAGRDEAHILYM